jgi:ComF family protein
LAYSPNHHCGECRRRVPFFDRIITPYAYEGTLARGIALFKAGRKTALVNALASLAFPFAAELRVAEIIIPVPLHPARLRAREFNQSLLLGDALARILNKPVKAHLLVKSGVTGLQKKLGRSDRQKNLKNSFELLNKAEIRGKSILLVDDVYTTGSTMNECAKVLKKGGSGPVTGYAVARTMLKPVR